METLKTAWDFFQTIVEATGLDPASRIGGSVRFFFYDTIKISIS